MVVSIKDFSSEEECHRVLFQLEKDIRRNCTIAQMRRDGHDYCIRLLFEGPCKCIICAQQFQPTTLQYRLTFDYETVLSDDEARKEAADLVAKTHKNYQYLQERCESHGNNLVKRWKKKTAEKRKALLLEAEPHMYPKQWSDIQFAEDFEISQQTFRHFGVPDLDDTQGLARRSHRNVCLLPYLNLEALKTDPARLLNILHHRVKYSSQQWAPFDNYLLDKQWKIGSLATSYNRNCVVMHGSEYGTLTPWQARSAHAWDIIGFPRAKLVLEAQLKLSEFLKTIVDKLLDGVEGAQQASLAQTLGLGLKKATDESRCVEFSSIFINQPYSAPPSFDIRSLLDISQAQLNLHTDHLWLLQTDPLSLRRYAGLVLDGRLKENLNVYNQYTIIAMKLMEDAMTLWTWNWILQEVQKLQLLGNRYQDRIRPGMELPSVYAQSLGCLEALLLELTRRLALHTLRLLPHRPGFRSQWNVKYIQQSQAIASTFQRKGDDRELIDIYTTDPLEFCLLTSARTLAFQPGDYVDAKIDYKWHQPSEIFAILDDHLSNAAKLGKKEDLTRLDEILYNSYSHLSALYQILFLVRLHQPRLVAHITFKDATKDESGKAWRYARAGYLDHTLTAQKTLGPLIGEFLTTPKPTGSRASQKWLDQDQVQREASSRLWAEMRSCHRQTCERLKIANEDIEDDLGVLSADLDPEHILELQNERDGILARIAEKEQQKATKNQPSKSEVQTHWGSDLSTEASNSVLDAKPKVKTRSDKPIEEEPRLADLIIAEEQQPPPSTKIAVSKPTLETIQSLYPKPNLEERTKSLKWTSFVSAMAEVGFMARQIHGSEYSFEPSPECKWHGRGRIVFHKPHPEPKYEAWKLLGMGKRMGKWFDWNADTFELLGSQK